MSEILNKMLNFVGLEIEEQEKTYDNRTTTREKSREKPRYVNQFQNDNQKRNKVVNIHSSSQLKVVVVQPQNIDDAQEICDHLKNQKPIIVNLEELDKDTAQRVVDFLSGSVYSLDGNIQKVSSTIFLIAPNNVDVMGNLKEGKGTDNEVLPWVK